jgi:hypothetical protein
MNQLSLVGTASVAMISVALLAQPGTRPGLDHPMPGQTPAPAPIATPAKPVTPVTPVTPATDPAVPQPDAPGAPATPPATRGINPAMIGAIMQGLKNSPGCMGADLGQLQSGKYVIFAWFESKKALVDWYNSAPHQNATNAVWPDRDKARVPLTDVPEDVGPIMAVAAASPVPASELKPGEAPYMRLGIEIYKPLPGGIRFGGGSFAPPTFKPGIREIDPGSVNVPMPATPPAPK